MNLSVFHRIILLFLISNLKFSWCQKFPLICPSGFVALGQAWYAEAPNGIEVSKLSRASTDLIHELTAYKPTAFSICVICSYSGVLFYHYDVEICIGHKNLRKENLVWVRKSKDDGDQKGTLVWKDAIYPVGIDVDLSKNEDLLSTLKDVQPITNLSRQRSNLNCPTGFQLNSFEARSPIAENGYLRRCIICSGPEYGSSFCVSWDDKYFESFLLPQLQVPDPDCPFNMKSTQKVCQLNSTQMMKGDQKPCGVYLDPKAFLDQVSLRTENLNFDCLNNLSCKF